MFTLRNATRISLVLIGIYLLTLAATFGRDGGWLIEGDGNKRAIEFVGVRAAGELTAEGKPAAAYDWTEHRRVHDRIVGRPSNEAYYPWPYPPPYLAIAHLLVAVPYLASALGMIILTLAGLAWVGRAIVGQNRAILFTLASPATYINTLVAHTGFLVGALFGGGLVVLRQRPILAGVVFGLLAIKPQLGLLVPVALMAGGYWRTIVSAAVTIAALVALSLLAYGVDPWLAFPGQLDRIADIFREGRVNFTMLVTVYGLLRWLAVPHVVAIAVQAVTAVALGVLVFNLWRTRDVPFELKSAGLIVASLLATPYLFGYDMTLLTVAMLFLARHAGAEGFDEVEAKVVVGGGTLLLAFAAIPFPVGLLCNLAAGLLVVRRWRALGAPITGNVFASGVPA